MFHEFKSLSLHPSWAKHLEGEFDQPYMRELQTFLQQQLAAGQVIFPAHHNIFNAFNAAPLNKVKVVILGQDPYHGAGQAHGLSFSVLPATAPPPSLVNIYKELVRDLGVPAPAHGCLQAWANQGVLLLNSVLTVNEAQAGSHAKRGWERFTDRAIELVSNHNDAVVFMLWGAYAQKKQAFIDTTKHLVLTAPHPSPLSVYRGFLGCNHFSIANQYLSRRKLQPISWAIE
jgi:uracil-DNA glycosylase